MLSRASLFALKPTEAQVQMALSGANLVIQRYCISYLNQQNPSHEADNKSPPPTNHVKK